MPKYIALIKQEGEGCDYTIACGKDWLEFSAPDLEAAKKRLARLIIGNRNDNCSFGYDGNYNYNRTLDLVILLEVNSKTSIPIKKWYDDARAVVAKAREDKVTKENRELYEN